MENKQEQNYIEKLISDGEKIEEIILSRNNIAEIKFQIQNKPYNLFDLNMTPEQLGKYM